MTNVVNMLDRRVYLMSDVDRLLKLTAGTGRRWIDGYTRNGTTYEPVIRVERTGEDAVTWGEFVELRMLAAYRDQAIRLPHLRRYVSTLRDRFATNYPLAHAAPYLTVEGRQLLLRVQNELADEPGIVFFEDLGTGQSGFTKEAQEFLDAVDWSPDSVGGDQVVSALQVDASLPEVRLDPNLRFGDPQIRGIPTAALAELYRAGDSMEQLADWYSLELDQVRQALSFEGLDKAA